jgi:DNA-binding beta-propeller fold protein YncE
VVTAVAALVGAAGCGQPRGVIFEPLETPMAWPPPPETPRIRYVGQLETSEDLKPGRSFGQGLGETLFGQSPDHSMLSPYAICAGEDGQLFVCDSNGQVVHVFDLDRRTYEQVAVPEPTPGFSQPIGVAVLGPDRLLVADSVAQTIFAFSTGGRYLGRFGAGLLQRPCGLAVDQARGRVFVADSAAHQVVVLDADGALVERLGRRGDAPGEFNYPTNVAVDDDGRLYVSDTLNFRVQVFENDLTPLRIVGSRGEVPGYFSQPKGVALDSEGHLYVVDAHFEAVQVFDQRGRLLLMFGSEGRGPGEFWLPAGIFIDDRDRIWVADSYNRRVQVFQYLPEGAS